MMHHSFLVKTSLFFCCTILLIPLFSHAATVKVNSALDTDADVSACTLRDALETINNGKNISNGCSGQGTFGVDDTITFDLNLSGKTVTLTGGQLFVSKDVTINGSGYPGYKITVDADSLSRVFTVSNAALSLIKVNLTNGLLSVSGNKGGGVYVTASGTLDLTESSVSNNTADLGGGVYLDSNSSMSLSGSSVNENTANVSGGGIYAYNSTIMATSQSEINSNQATVNGGGVYAYNSQISLIELSMVGYNIADGDGGGLFMTSPDIHVSPDLSVIRSKIERNWAKNYGGGVASVNSIYMSFKYSVITDNDSTNDGGALYTDTHTATGTVVNKIDISHSIISNNRTSQSGGGLALNGSSPVSIYQTSIQDNHVQYVGGAIFQRGDSQVTIRKSSIIGNEKDSIALIYGEFYIRNSTLAANSNESGSSVGIKNSGGGVSLDNVTVGRNYKNSLLGGNGPDDTGGKFYLKNTILVSPCLLTENATLLPLGGNFVQADPNNCGDFFIENQDPKLGVLMFNDGSPPIGIPTPSFIPKTYTYALLAGSPAIDTGTPSAPPRLPESCIGSTDQREISRADGFCDIGAYEVENEADKIESPTCYVIKSANGTTIIFCL